MSALPPKADIASFVGADCICARFATFCRMTGSGPTSNRFNSALEEMRSVPRYTVPVTMPRTLSHWSTLLLIAFSCGNGRARAFRFVAPARRERLHAASWDWLARALRHDELANLVVR